MQGGGGRVEGDRAPKTGVEKREFGRTTVPDPGVSGVLKKEGINVKGNGHPGKEKKSVTRMGQIAAPRLPEGKKLSLGEPYSVLAGKALCRFIKE